MRCPVCRFDDSKVVDSRAADEGASIRRRRSCLACGERFTTYERIDRAPLVVVKRTGQRQPFDRAKLVEGVTLASKGRPVAAEQIELLATEVEDQIRLDGPEVTTTAVGLAVLERLRALDEVAYLRFASVYKNFSGAEDFRRELRLLAKLTDTPA
jgi:transcriptional repressor NrdR